MESPVSSASTVHPRARGKHSFYRQRESRLGGSSPRTRETQNWGQNRKGNYRFIPAHAGNTSKAAIAKSSCSVHPRARGKHAAWCAIAKTEYGSSPRTRETRWSGWVRSRWPRFIPAHAGNTSLLVAGLSFYAVHPRARGKHNFRGVRRRVVFGSSPRTRETPYSRDVSTSRRRFIPAHAGNTKFGMVAEVRKAVHPRARGKHVPPSCFQTNQNGSSPRTRETLFHGVKRQ